MQIATLHNGAPRVNSVYYVTSDDLSTLYWMSEPSRRHSEDILQDARIGGAIAVKVDWPVGGLQFIGTGSELVDKDESQIVVEKYNAKYDDVAAGLLERIENGTNKHRIYKLSIESMELFDEVNFPGGKVVAVPIS